MWEKAPRRNSERVEPRVSEPAGSRGSTRGRLSQTSHGKTPIGGHETAHRRPSNLPAGGMRSAHFIFWSDLRLAGWRPLLGSMFGVQSNPMPKEGPR
jgi:hypothetical protein